MVEVEVRPPRVLIFSSNPAVADSATVVLDISLCHPQGSSEHYLQATNQIHSLHFRDEETNVQNGKGTARACSYSRLSPLNV